MVHVDRISAALITLTLGVAIGSLVLNIIILSKQKDRHGTDQTDTSTTPPPNSATSTSPLPTSGTSTAPPPATCPQPWAPPGKISNTTGFKEAADHLLRGLDFSVDPCDDFYQFTCAKYLKDTPIPPGRSRIGTYDEAQEAVNDVIVAGIEGDRKNKVSTTETLLRTVYDSCLNDTKGPRPDRSKAVYDTFVAAWGGVPALNTTAWKALTPEEFWARVGSDEGSFALPTLVQSFVSADWGQATQHALYLNQGPLANPRDFYVQPPFLSQITQYLNDVKKLFRDFAGDIKSGVKPETLDAAATKVVQFEIEIALAMVPDDLQRNYEQQYNPHTLDDLAKKYPNIKWTQYFKSLLSRSTVDGKASSVNFVVVQPSYFGVLDDIFGPDQYSERLDTFVNFIFLRLLQNSANYIGGEFRDIISRSSQFKGRGGKAVDASEDDKQFCINTITNYFPYATGYVYVKNIAQRDDMRKDVETQTEYVVEEFLKMVQTLPWITNDTLTYANLKASNLTRNVGWPFWFNFTDGGAALDNYHVKYNSTVTGGLFFNVLTQLQKASQLTENFDLLSTPVERRNFGGSPSTVNAWYIPERNSITFPLAILNPPYYRLDFPQAYNYAGQGGTGGHELSHGFDDEGVQYGPTGDLNKPKACEWDRCGWMDYSSTLGFISMAQCVVSQYSEKCCPLTTGNVHCANGATTQGENLADLAGQQAAYFAYRRYIKEKRNGEEEDRLPGLEQFTPNQIFWITYGFSWCMNQETDNLVNQLLTNPHAPGSCRVNQVMQDIPQFGEDFKCKPGSPMYPQASGRCKVWTGN